MQACHNCWSNSSISINAISLFRVSSFNLASGGAFPVFLRPPELAPPHATAISQLRPMVKATYLPQLSSQACAWLVT